MTKELVERLWEDFCAAMKPIGELPGGVEEIDFDSVDSAGFALKEALESQSQELARLRGALTPSADTKAAYMGEFTFSETYTNEDGNDVTVACLVPWTTIKEIMAAIRARAALSGEGE